MSLDRAVELYRDGAPLADILESTGVCMATLYRRLARLGVPRRRRLLQGVTWQERFWPYVDKTDPSGCWLWTGAISRSGYGSFARTPKLDVPAAHRVMWELVVGPIPEGLQLDHLCRVRHCVNPAHLEPVTAAENIRRSRCTTLTMEQAREIRESTDLHRVIAAKFGISRQAVSKIRLGQRWAEEDAA